MLATECVHVAPVFIRSHAKRSLATDCANYTNQFTIATYCAGLQNLTARPSNNCPWVTFNCSVHLSATTLRWFYNADPIADYAINPAHSYPRSLALDDTTIYNSLAGGVDIQILAAIFEDETRSMASFLSTMRVNVSALQEAGVSNVACGTFNMMSTIQLAG